MAESTLAKTQPLSSNKVPQTGNDLESNKPQFEEYTEADAGDGTTREEQLLQGKKLVLCVVSISLCLFLVALDLTITAALLTEVSNHFQAFNRVTWITSAFMLATGCLTQVWGKISIVFGRKWTMLAGILFFEIGSLVSALSNSMDMLIGGRVIQGIGSANIQTLAFVICSEITTIDKKPVIFALMGVIFTVSSVIGPIIGGAFTSYVSWRWCFYINLFFGAIATPSFYFSFNPRTPKGTIISKLKKLDYLGMFFMISSVVLLLLALSFGTTEFSWDSAAVICCFVLSGFLGIGFCVWNFKYSPEPLILKSIMKVPRLQMAILSVAFGSSTFMVVIQFVSVYFQVIRGCDPVHTGYSLIPFIVASTFFGILSGFIIKKTRFIKPFAILGAIWLCVGSGLLCLLRVEETFSRRVGLLILVGVGGGFVGQPGIVSVQMLAPKEPGALILSSAFLNFAKNVGPAVFSQVAQVIYTETLKSNIKSIADKVSTHEDLLILFSDTSLLKTLSKEDQFIIKSVILKSIDSVFYLCVALCACGILVSLFMSNAKLPKGQKGKEVNNKFERKDDTECL